MRKVLTGRLHNLGPILGDEVIITTGNHGSTEALWEVTRNIMERLFVGMVDRDSPISHKETLGTND